MYFLGVTKEHLRYSKCALLVRSMWPPILLNSLIGSATLSHRGLMYLTLSIRGKTWRSVRATADATSCAMGASLTQRSVKAQSARGIAAWVGWLNASCRRLSKFSRLYMNTKPRELGTVTGESDESDECDAGEDTAWHST